MKKLITLLLLLLSVQAAASQASSAISYREFNAIALAATAHLLKNSSEAEVTLDLSYTAVIGTSKVVFISRLTRGFTPAGLYEEGYQYSCSQADYRTVSRSVNLEACSRVSYHLHYQQDIKKAL
jgi:hypothetical protein